MRGIMVSLDKVSEEIPIEDLVRDGHGYAPPKAKYLYVPLQIRITLSWERSMADVMAKHRLNKELHTSVKFNL